MQVYIPILPVFYYQQSVMQLEYFYFKSINSHKSLNSHFIVYMYKTNKCKRKRQKKTRILININCTNYYLIDSYHIEFAGVLYNIPYLLLIVTFIHYYAVIGISP